MTDIAVKGITVFGFCHDLYTSIKGLWHTLKLYIGGMGNDVNAWLSLYRPVVPQYMVEANIEFLEQFVGLKFEHVRGEWADKIIDFDEREFKSGDFLAITRLDGLESLIKLGRGRDLDTVLYYS
jgi:hypothetical protein